MSKKILKWINFLIGGTLIAYLLSQLDFEELAEIGNSIDIRLALLSLVCYGAMVLLQALRWYYLLRDYPITFLDVLRIFLIGYFLNNFLPGSIGGDGYKVYYLNKIEKGLGKAATVTLVDRIVGMGVLSGIIVLYGILNWGQVKKIFTFNLGTDYMGKVGISLGILLFLSLSILLFLRSSYATKVKSFIHQCWVVFKKITFLQMTNLTILAIMAHLIKSLSFLLLLTSLGGSCSFFTMLFATSVVGWLIILPISIGGLGVREGALVVLLHKFGILMPIAIAFSLSSRFIIYFTALIGGLVFLTKDKPDNNNYRSS